MKRAGTGRDPRRALAAPCRHRAQMTTCGASHARCNPLASVRTRPSGAAPLSLFVHNALRRY